MADKNIQVVEVSEENGQSFFLNPADRKPQQNSVRTWSKKGSLLALTASEAVQCGIAVVAAQNKMMVQRVRRN